MLSVRSVVRCISLSCCTPPGGGGICAFCMEVKIFGIRLDINLGNKTHYVDLVRVI